MIRLKSLKPSEAQAERNRRASEGLLLAWKRRKEAMKTVLENIEQAVREGRITHVQAGNLTVARVSIVKAKKVKLVEASFSPPGTWAVPLHVVSGDNSRGNRAKIGRAGHERKAVAKSLAGKLAYVTIMAAAIQYGEALRVTLTRLGPGRMDDDGIASACKYVRDTIAMFLGVDDGSPLYRWVYAQEKSAAYGVRIELSVEE